MARRNSGLRPHAWPSLAADAEPEPGRPIVVATHFMQGPRPRRGRGVGLMASAPAATFCFSPPWRRPGIPSAGESGAAAAAPPPRPSGHSAQWPSQPAGPADVLALGIRPTWPTDTLRSAGSPPPLDHA